MTYYWYYFEDGYACCVKGMSNMELKIEEYKHGKLIKKVKV